MNNWYTKEIGISDLPCPKCGGKMKHFVRPINVNVLSCPACNEEFNPMYVKGFLDGQDTRNLTLRETDTGIPAGLENTSSEAIPGVVDEIEELWDDTPQS